ncbi:MULTISPECIES: hypothetical protein [unclassified Ruegeria]|uniref:hypothetical protein n=1 Tax=unclassified Ruegeria TaxID=2625375 RepID=UPI001488EA9C|nr:MULTISPECIES: hypothetical protein [unclassified Ruegeria]NOD61888.1 hypothetical protein [Ruegeria sp. HKCCD6109]
MDGAGTAGISTRLKTFIITTMLLALTALAGWGLYAIPGPVVDRMLESDLRHRVV